MERVNAGELQRQVIKQGVSPLNHLPFFGQTDQSPFVVEFSHLLSAYPKTGKTELLVRLVSEWSTAGLNVLYLTEEPRKVWEARLYALPPGLENVELVFAFGMSQAEIKQVIKAGTEAVVVLDTIRLLKLKDEKDNAEIIRVLTPIIKACRDGNKTSIFAHHNRKGGGEHGEAASGGHAFFGIVDIGLEIGRVPQVPRQRLIKGLGRVAQIPALIYELREDGTMVLLGDPQALKLNQVKERVLTVMTGEWRATKEIRAAIGSPLPSIDQMSFALVELARDGLVERDPPVADGQKRGKTYRWRNLTSDDPFALVGSEVAADSVNSNGAGGAEGQNAK